MLVIISYFIPNQYHTINLVNKCGRSIFTNRETNCHGRSIWSQLFLPSIRICLPLCLWIDNLLTNDPGRCSFLNEQDMPDLLWHWKGLLVHRPVRTRQPSSWSQALKRERRHQSAPVWKPARCKMKLSPCQCVCGVDIFNVRLTKESYRSAHADQQCSCTPLSNNHFVQSKNI